MALCTGTSERRPGAPAAVYLTPEYMSGLLPVPLVWLEPFLPYIPPILIADLDTFCSVDPPPINFAGLAFAGALAGGQVGASLVVLDAISEAVRYYAWFAFCRCSSGPDATPGTPPLAPTDLPAINPDPFVHLPLAEPCAAVGPTNSLVTGGQRFSAGGVDGSGRNVTMIRATLSNTTTIGAGCVGYFEFNKEYPVSPVTPVIVANYELNPNSTRVVYLPHDPAQPVMWVFQGGVAGGGEALLEATIEMFCDGDTPGAPAAPCCPPDPALVGLLNQILQAVTLIQRQQVPFGYIPGAAHAGLSGSGSFNVSGILGVRLELTSIDASAGELAGVPTKIFDQGFVTLGTADGYEHSRAIDHHQQLVLPIAAGAFTKVGYSLAPNVVLTITELLREP